MSDIVERLRACDCSVHCKSGCIQETAAAEIERLRAALDTLVRRLDAVHIHPAYQSVWMLHQLHAGSYNGPKYENELAQARRALERKE
jgi:hypothetical protein